MDPMESTPSTTTPPPPPAAHPRGRISALVRQTHRENARRDGDDNQLWVEADSLCRSINSRFHHRHDEPDAAQQHQQTLAADAMERLEWDMHDLWHLFYHASSTSFSHSAMFSPLITPYSMYIVNISEDSPAADRLALQIVQMREQGPLVRDSPGEGAVKAAAAATSDGHVWTDLPFLVSDMAQYWVQDHAAMSSPRRLRFAKFLAKLASAGVGRDDGLCTGIALRAFRQALEMPRPLGTLADQDQVEDASRSEAGLSVAALLPSVNVWFSWAGLKLIQLCEAESPDSAAQGEYNPGPLVGSAGTADSVEHGAPLGFSIRRWLFWLTRLENLAGSFRDAGQDALAAFATGTMDNMLITVEGTGGRLRRELAAAYLRGEVQHRPISI